MKPFLCLTLLLTRKENNSDWETNCGVTGGYCWLFWRHLLPAETREKCICCPQLSVWFLTLQLVFDFLTHHVLLTYWNCPFNPSLKSHIGIQTDEYAHPNSEKLKSYTSRCVYPAWHGRASENSVIAGLSQNSPGGQSEHSPTSFSPRELDREPVGQGRG